MKYKIFSTAMALTILMAACKKDDDTVKQIETPATYSFERDGKSSVDFSGQTTRILMAQEIASAFTDNTKTQSEIQNMFAHVQGANDFSDADLNASDKSVRSKVAASSEYFASNTTLANAIKAKLDGFISAQTTDVFPNWDSLAVEGKAGQIQQAGGGSIRYVNANGLELNQAFAKSIIGALMADQILNNYLSPSVLDAGSSVEDNNNGVLVDGKSYTNMEHKWDEAYGYLYGNEADPSNPVLGADKFLNEYLEKVEEDTDFEGIAKTVFDAFKLGRAAITEGNYTVRDQQVAILREQISKVIAVRAVYYLQSGKNALTTDKARAFHSLSEGYGFIYSLQFTQNPLTNAPYFSNTEVEALLSQLDNNNGFWNITDSTIDTISTEIANKFGFTVEQAGS